jgi:hypothetical protein
VTRNTLIELADIAEPATDTELPTKQGGKAGDPTQVVVRIVNSIRQLMHMEARLAGVETPKRTAPRRPLTDVRRDIIRRAIDILTAKSRDRVKLRRAAAAKLDEYLAADPKADTPAATLIRKVGEKLGMTIDFAKLPDDLKQALAGT